MQRFGIHWRCPRIDEIAYLCLIRGQGIACMHYRETLHQPTNNGAVLQTKQALLDHSPIRQTRQELEEIPNYFIFLLIFQVKSVHHYMLDK